MNRFKVFFRDYGVESKHRYGLVAVVPQGFNYCMVEVEAVSGGEAREKAEKCLEGIENE